MSPDRFPGTRQLSEQNLPRRILLLYAASAAVSLTTVAVASRGLASVIEHGEEFRASIKAINNPENYRLTSSRSATSITGWSIGHATIEDSLTSASDKPIDISDFDEWKVDGEDTGISIHPFFQSDTSNPNQTQKIPLFVIKSPDSSFTPKLPLAESTDELNADIIVLRKGGSEHFYALRKNPNHTTSFWPMRRTATEK